MAVGDTRTATNGEPEIELADGSWTTDWASLTPSTQNVAPTLMVGNAWRWDRTDSIPDHLLPRDGQTISNVDVDYPALWSIRTLSTLIASFDDVAKTITLDDFNITGRFERGSQTPGTEQGHALQNHAHTVKTNTNNSGAGPGNNNARAGWNGAIWDSASGVGAEDIVNAQGSPAVQVDDETRPINKSYVSCIIAKPWIVSGDTTINQLQSTRVLITGDLTGGNTFSVPLVNSGRSLINVEMKLDNGFNKFSPPANTNAPTDTGGSNRWWYDFDPAIGEINVARFGAWAGAGNYRVIAEYL